MGNGTQRFGEVLWSKTMKSAAAEKTGGFARMGVFSNCWWQTLLYSRSRWDLRSWAAKDFPAAETTSGQSLHVSVILLNDIVCPSKTTAPLIWCCLQGILYTNPGRRCSHQNLAVASTATLHRLSPHKMSPPAKSWNDAKSFLSVCAQRPCRLKWSEPPPLWINHWWKLVTHSSFVFIYNIIGCWDTASHVGVFGPGKASMEQTFHFDVQMWGDCALRHPATRWSPSTEFLYEIVLKSLSRCF